MPEVPQSSDLLRNSLVVDLTVRLYQAITAGDCDATQSLVRSLRGADDTVASGWVVALLGELQLSAGPGPRPAPST